MKEKYLELMQIALETYSLERIHSYIAQVEANGLNEHGFARLTANMGILIAQGIHTELEPEFLKMMDICCSEIPNGNKLHGPAANEFSVKEIVLCILELEKAGLYADRTPVWREKLAAIIPEETYTVVAHSPEDKLHNWAQFGATSEQVRKFAGIGSCDSFIDLQTATQLDDFDENGMYRDPDCPMVYDIIERLNFALSLFCGYNGVHEQKMRELMQKSAYYTLYCQSANGEFAYGGRSNQFYHVDTSFAALCEYYACEFKKLGDMEKAGAFRQAAGMAIKNVINNIRKNGVHHIRNLYPIDSKIGCEGYGYFNKYMITTASWAYLAYLFCDDSIEPDSCPARLGGFAWKTSDDFHKYFVLGGHYTVEIEYNADFHYDANGIGRIHRVDSHSAHCLSTPFTVDPNYTIEKENPFPLSIACGVHDGDGFILGSAEGTKYDFGEPSTNYWRNELPMRVTLTNGVTLGETVVVSQNMVSIDISGEGDILLALPIFEFDGEKETTVHVRDDKITVNYDNEGFTYITDGKFTSTDLRFCNRNGRYRLYIADGKDRLNVKII